jgi:hypothetical protein
LHWSTCHAQECVQLPVLACRVCIKWPLPETTDAAIQDANILIAGATLLRSRVQLGDHRDTNPDLMPSSPSGVHSVGYSVAPKDAVGRGVGVEQISLHSHIARSSSAHLLKFAFSNSF